MAKGKPVTAEEIKSLIGALNECRHEAIDIVKRIENGHAGELPKAYEYARDLVHVSRSIGDLISALFLVDGMERMKAQTAARITKHRKEGL